MTTNSFQSTSAAWFLPVLALLAAGSLALNISVRVLDGGFEERSLTLSLDATNSTVAVTWQQWDGPFLSSLLHTTQVKMKIGERKELLAIEFESPKIGIFAGLIDYLTSMSFGDVGSIVQLQ